VVGVKIIKKVRQTDSGRRENDLDRCCLRLLSLAVLIQYRRVTHTHRHTDRHTDTR